MVGFVMGIAEDLIAIHFATDAAITMDVVIIAALVALPFAIFSELIIDWKHMKFVHRGVDNVKSVVKKTQLLSK